jgi:heterodisulfide reductase subunit A-like polyferredoxin
MSAEGQIALFVCSWSSGRGLKLDLEALRGYAASLPEVAFAQVVDQVCSDAGQKKIIKELSQAEVDRFVIVACQRRAKEAVYRRIAENGGIAPFLFEVADIQEQAANVHERSEAQAKAEDLIRMAVAKCRLLAPVPFEVVPPASQRALVVGSGASALEASERIAGEGFEVVLAASALGLAGPASMESVQALRARKNVDIREGAEVVEFEGYPGDFRALLETPAGMVQFQCGAVVLAIDAVETPGPAATVSQSEFLSMFQRGEPLPSNIVMITGYGREGCGESCGSAAVTNALKVMETFPSARVTIIAKDVWTLGLCELSYRDAGRCGVQFVRSDEWPARSKDGRSLIVNDAVLGHPLSIRADLVISDSMIQPAGTSELAALFGVPLDGQGYLRSTSVRLRGGETVRAGVFLCGTAARSDGQMPAPIVPASAASLACEILGASSLEFGGAVAEVDKDKCSACLACVRVCPYNAPLIREAGKAEIDMKLCQGCGACVGLCPSEAIGMHRFTDAQIVAQERAFVQGAGR